MRFGGYCSGPEGEAPHHRMPRDMEDAVGSKRGMRRGARMTLEIALMGDGVAPADVYKVLATPQGQQRAFAALDRLPGAGGRADGAFALTPVTALAVRVRSAVPLSNRALSGGGGVGEGGTVVVAG